MVATSQPLAAQVGLAVLADGGNAVDAAIATAAALTVVEPCSNGLGSDAFALIWDGRRLHGFNGSGPWPEGHRQPPPADAATGQFPAFGWPSVTVPGAVDTWSALHERFGRIDVNRLLAPAQRYAEAGFPVSPIVAVQWAGAAERYRSMDRPDVAGWEPVFAPGGQPPQAGQRWSSPGHARTLALLAERGWRDFYEGQVAEAIADYARSTGGVLTADDLAGHRGRWVEPLSVPYGDYDVWELPPNGQGLAALVALGIAAHTPAPHRAQLDPVAWHYQIEAMKVAFAASDRVVADPDQVAETMAATTALLDPDGFEAQAQQIGLEAGPAPQGQPVRGGTVYLCCADAEGMMVSFIQSNYMGFGSGVVVPDYGIALQNRAACFSLDPEHPNYAVAGRRPRHTIIPGFLTRTGDAVGPFGVMGGEMQPQGHLQVVSGLADHGLNPQAALDAPRWQVDRDGTVHLESTAPDAMLDKLRKRGHDVVRAPSRMLFGRGQIILRDDRGVYVGGTEPRADGAVLGF
jgi:gamma-glutamyltranspeptidase/glutathione hydrolase